MFKPIILSAINQHNEIINKINVNEIEIVVQVIIKALKNGSSILWCGNGGSASQANHLSAELIGGMHKEKKMPYKSISLCSDTTFLTAWSNDDSFDNIFSRQIQSLSQSGDVLIGLTTSGNSKNLINSFKLANEKEVITISLTGNNGGELKKLSKFNINIEDTSTQRIQEMHILIGHIICDLIELKA